ncbi:hypothetical protein GWI33_003986 [Rhynchophorus ferrugineus]|uniref:Uncharacterized protein n=1 Tax=Rhynchophorus ferrugineus TaxID=354439 RepID=A0A834M076_RHYFE|nr:hypothetical protein GWI33_003986 [Rhynchophorus ferrugineus]
MNIKEVFSCALKACQILKLACPRMDDESRTKTVAQLILHHHGATLTDYQYKEILDLTADNNQKKRRQFDGDDGDDMPRKIPKTDSDEVFSRESNSQAEYNNVLDRYIHVKEKKSLKIYRYEDDDYMDFNISDTTPTPKPVFSQEVRIDDIEMLDLSEKPKCFVKPCVFSNATCKDLPDPTSVFKQAVLKHFYFRKSFSADYPPAIVKTATGLCFSAAKAISFMDKSVSAAKYGKKPLANNVCYVPSHRHYCFNNGSDNYKYDIDKLAYMMKNKCVISR